MRSEKKKPPKVKQSSPEPTRTRSGSWRKYDRGPVRPKSDKFCHFHNEYGHDTNNCFHLRDEIERMIQASHLKEFIYQDRQSPRGQKRNEP
ncbi:hypothetical protein ACS0TY_010663 [Phlomoides rotata]